MNDRLRQNKLQAQFALLKAIRTYFENENFIDVLTPPAVENPGMETHTHPFLLYHVHANKKSEQYLHTSPEFAMKELLTLGFENIFNISYCFRDEPNATHHRFQFLMLEWYRTNTHYKKIMDDVEGLISFSAEYLISKKIPVIEAYKNLKPERATLQEIFQEHLKFDLLNFLETKDLKELIEKNFKDVPLPVMGEELSFDDYFFLLFLNKIEPELKKYPCLLLYEFPFQLAALSTLKPDDSRVCERFEVYCHGIELCNSFNELTNYQEQKKRFDFQKLEKKRLYGYELPEPTKFYHTLQNNYPTSAGIALGVERLLRTVSGYENPFWD